MNVVICLPGDSFSNDFLKCWTEFLFFCNRAQINPIISIHKNSNVYFVRSICLGASVIRGVDQKPFDGKIDYDYIMWIDSDIIFQPIQFAQLIERGEDICGGLYLMEGGKQYAAVKNWDIDYFRNNGTFQFLTPDDIKDITDIIEVSYTGFGFLLMKRGVIERIEYPWFEPVVTEFDENIKDFASEDVSFCKKANKFGITIHIDPTVIVGHEKSTVLI